MSLYPDDFNSQAFQERYHQPEPSGDFEVALSAHRRIQMTIELLIRRIDANEDELGMAYYADLREALEIAQIRDEKIEGHIERAERARS